MKSTQPDRLIRLKHLRTVFAVILLACVLGFLAQVSEAGGLMLWRRTAPKEFTLPIASLGMLAVVFLSLSYTRLDDLLLKTAERVFQWLASLRWFNTALFLLMGVLLPWLSLSNAGQAVTLYTPRIFIYGLSALVGSILLMADRRGRSWFISFAAAATIYAVIFRVALYVPQVSDYFFSMGWSEASRYYNASLFFSRQIYGEAVPLPTLHPTRYLLQSLPFLVPGLPLWFHRLWQALLWLALNGAAAWLLGRRFSPQDAARRWLLAGWAFLFFFQGPIYYHL
ncbi:MAG: hypothetical protein AAGU05_14565, partial [Anaerolineaceae bacterium]